MGAPPLDLTGQRFGRLVVVERYKDNTKAGKSQWRVCCDCGIEKIVVGGSLVSGLVKSCGCYSRDKARGKFIDLVGKHFGNLTVVELLSNRTEDKRRIWRSVCDCGNEIIISSDGLRKRSRLGCSECYPSIRFKDETGKVYNKWTVLVRLPNQGTSATFLCECECGNTARVSAANLRSGASSQCRECGDNTGKTKTHGLSRTPEYARWSVNKRLERKKILDSAWTLEMEVVLHEFFRCCCICGSDQDLEVDHLLPLSLGYGLFVDNAVVLCSPCNLTKNNKYVTDMSPEIRHKLIEASCAFQEYWEGVNY